MRDLAVLFLHLLTTIARLGGPGGARAVVAESVLVKHQLLILNRSRHRAPNLRPADRMVAGVCAVLIRPGRLIRAAIVLQPSTFVRFHRALVQQKYRRLFSSTVPKTPGPKGPHPDVIAAVVAMKQRNPTWGCPRIAQQITLAFGSSLDKDVVRRILAARYQPAPGSGPSWLTTLICSEMRIRHSQEDQRSIRFLRRTRQNHAPRVPWLWLRSSPAVHGRNPSHDECKRFGCAPWTLVACVQHVAIKTEPSIPKMHGYAIRVFVVDNHASRSYNGNAVA